jgi:hypothetical protein
MRKESGKAVGTFRAPLVMLLAAALLLAAPPVAAADPPRGGEKRYLVRFDHGSANLAPWAGIALYVGPEAIRVLAGNTVVHMIPPASVTAILYELRAPFDPARTTEKVFNDTLGACSNVVDCPLLGAAGAVGAAGVGIATLFTPKENVITLEWTENGEPRILAMKIAWYQRDFILRALENATGRTSAERAPGLRAAKPQPAPAGARPGPSVTSTLAGASAADTAPAKAAAEAQPSIPPPAQGYGGVVVTQAAAPAPAARGLTPRIELVLDRAARVGDATLAPGFYLLLIQVRTDNTSFVVFLDDAVRGAASSRIVARAAAEILPAVPGVEDALPVFSEAGGNAVLAEVRLAGRTLRFVSPGQL